ncbi:acyl-CoA dehydrogenase family protein [Myxococcota bacterium]|nr:acyl-CoA dehydrogenase family protein [Myxococcota bacterium]
MEFSWLEADLTFRRELIDFLQRTLPEEWDEMAKDGPGGDAQATYSREFCAALAEHGWLTQHWPKEYGGKDATPWRHAIVGEEMWKVGEPRGAQYMNVNWVGPTIMKYGTEEQKALHLPLISSGNVLWCQGFSEPEAGSDLVALRTLALREGDHYVVNGSKIWTSYVNHADYCFLVARSDPESKRHQGITVLLLPMDLDGIEVREIPSVVGERYFHEVFFTDVRVPVSCRLGPENAGWDVVTYSLAYERVGAARYARAVLTLDALAEHARERGLLEDPTVLERLSEAREVCEMARLLTYRVIDLRAKDSSPTADTNVARVAGTMAERAVSELALAVFGTDALVYGNFGESYFRMAMTAGVATGTTEVNLNLVASRFLGLPRE